MLFEKDTEELQSWKAEQTGTEPGPMQPWEVSYWAEKRRKAEYDYDERRNCGPISRCPV